MANEIISIDKLTSISKSKHNQNLTTHLEDNAYVNKLYEQSNLTRLQVLYWLGQSLRKDSQIFNTIYSYTIYDEVDQSQFERSFQSMVHQSDAFRAVIVKENGIPQLSFLNYVPKDLKYVDFSGEKNPEAEYELWLLEQSGAILDLSICSYDSALIKINDTQYIWYLNQHHMLVDANSFSVIFRRLARLYERLMVGEDLILEGTPNFQDYVAYERKYRQSPQYERAKVYWDEKLNNPPEELLFFGRAPRKKTTKVIRRSTDLGQDRSSFLRNFTQQEGIFTINEELSLFNLFAGMFFILLHQLSGNRRLGFVTPVHNRFNEQFRDTIGLLIEFSPIQIELAGEDTLESIIKKVKQETRETMAYYQYGSGIMAQKSGFDVMFNTYRVPEMTLDNAKVLAKRIHPGHGTESLALHVTDVEYSQSIELHFDFHEDVFNPEQQEKIIEGYVKLLDKLIIDSNQRIDGMNVFAPKRDNQPIKNTQEDVGFQDFNRPRQVPPKDLLEFLILRIWEDVLENPSIGVNDNFFELGGNSWLAVKMFVELEKKTNKYLPLTTLLKAGTIAEIAKIIRKESDSEIWSTVVTIQPGKSKKPIFFAPGAAENGLAVARIAQHLGDDQPVYMFQIPIGSSENKDILYIEEMAEVYVAALRANHPEGPYILGGYSAGGMIALEAARQLKDQGHDVELLVIIDVPAQSPKYKYLKQFMQWSCSILHINEVHERKLFLLLRDIIFRLDYFINRGFVDWVYSFIERINRFTQKPWNEKYQTLRIKFGLSAPDGSNNRNRRVLDKGSIEEGDDLWFEYDQHMREHFRLVNEAVKSYIPVPYSGRVVLFRSSFGYRRPEMRMADPLMGWDKIVPKGLDSYVIPGNHLHIVREPNVAILGEQLIECIESI